MRLAGWTVVFALFCVSSATAAGFSRDANFLVFTPSGFGQDDGQQVADYVLARANELRDDIAIEWFGEAIPPGIGRTSINVNFHEGKESALTWAKDRPDRLLHKVYLRTTPERFELAVAEMLPHEMVHVVLATRYPHPNRLPVWIEEGIASRYDDAQRMRIRHSTVRWWGQTGDWPRLATLFHEKKIDPSDANGYAAAASVVDFLLSRSDTSTLLAFARDGQTSDWDGALQTHYHIENTIRLQSLWQSWISESGKVAAR